ncbi:MAG: POTRA domain-containing protein, partial [Ignavibacteria bacterium]|nr:POTRA domain-containing protein [Ignavibacteria bacterium]
MTKKSFLIAILFSLTLTTAQEANKIELTSIDFTGNSAYSSSMLKDVISSKETPSWFWQFLNSISSSIGKEAVYFDSLQLRDDLIELKNFYNSNGFFEANFSSSFKIDTTKNEAEVVFAINERNPSSFTKIKLMGLQDIPTDLKEGIDKDFAALETKRFSQALLKSNNDAVIENLNNSGYMLAGWDRSIIEKDTTKNLANVEVYFKPHIRYKISELQIEKKGEGSDYVETELLKDLVGIKIDEYYNAEKIRQSQVRLYRTGLFSYVQVIPITEDTSGHF